jgi:cysteine synthase A
MSQAAVAELAPTGVLRAGINLSNFLLVSGRSAAGDPEGVAPDMARAIAEHLGVAVAYVTYARPGELADAAGQDVWDIGLIAAEPARAETIAFSPAYAEIEATYLVPAGSPIGSVRDVDRPGVRIAIAARSAYDLWLSRHLRHARLVRGPSLDASYELFVAEKLDALAGLRPRLLQDVEKLPGARILDGRFTAVQQAVGTAKANAAGARFLSEFVEEARASGLVARLIERHQIRGLSVAPRGWARAAGSGSAPRAYGTHRFIPNVFARERVMTSRGARTTEGRGRLFDSIVETIGDTPCIRVNTLAPRQVRLYVKAEFFNPAGSVKDRLAVSIIQEAERSGALQPGQTVVEATSGNTGIGLAMVCAAKGYPLVVTMADSFSIERRKLMRFLGAKVVLTPRALKGYGMYQKAVELAEANGWFLARQFETAANARIHENTTAREILADFEGERLDYYVTGYGTGGTVSGVGRVLRKARPETRIILSEPANAQLVGSGRAQRRNHDGSPGESHPAFEPHPIQGWTPDFIPLVLQEAIDGSYYDELIPVAGAVAIEWSRKLAQKEGVFTGISGGATFAVAMQIAERAEPGSVILCMLPDTGERYLSSPLFDGIEETMTEDEIALSLSTPGFHMPAA